MTILLEATGISKSFGASTVLSDVSLSLKRGEVVSLIGENGAGKSTLAKILCGIVQPDTGTLKLDGKTVTFFHPREALAARIGIVHQELNLAENLTIAENFLLGHEPTRFGALDRKKMEAITRDGLARLGLSLDPHRLVATLSTAQRQMVEIARALSFDTQLLIFDEPTSSLSEEDSKTLLQLIKKLKAQGVSILYVSHRLPEVQEISDRIIALRDGKNSGEAIAPDITRDKLITMIVGREISDIYGYKIRPRGEEALRVQNFQASERHTPTSFAVHRGEIVGIAGLVGSGRSELLESVFGMRAPCVGSLFINGSEVAISSPRQAWDNGLALVPESRKDQGVILESSIRENIILSDRKRKSPLTLRDFAEEEQASDSFIESLRIRCSSGEQLTKNLSGGNQQKVVIGRCLSTTPSVLLLDEPTRGVDVGARREIYSILFQLAEQGMAILFVSSELEEVLGIADRVLVMSDGDIKGDLSRKEASEHAIMSLASTHQQVAA
jgi:ribose transport system ATP-binding protein